MNLKKVLIIEDENSISDLLDYSIQKEGFITKVVSNGKDGLEQVEEFKPNLILLDLMLPDISGFDICKKLTSEYIIPIIMITAKSDMIDKILGMELGADDYITKPFDIREVIVRIKAVFRRIELMAESEEAHEFNVIQVIDGIELFKDKREVLKDGVRVELTNKEYNLLVFFLENRGRVFSREDLLNKVWGFDFLGDTRTVDTHVQRLRKKLEYEAGYLIETIYGVGYKFL